MTAASTCSRAAAAIVSLALGFGCASEEGGDDADAAADDGAASDSGGTGVVQTDDGDAMTGVVEFTFTATSTVTQSSSLVDPLVGTVYGGLFRTADVGVTGPREDAEQLAYVEAAGVDLTVAPVSAVLWTSEGLPPGDYSFLGFLDVDASSATLDEKDPEMGDPVTLPTVNKFTIEAGATAQHEVRFDLVL